MRFLGSKIIVHDCSYFFLIKCTFLKLFTSTASQEYATCVNLERFSKFFFANFKILNIQAYCFKILTTFGDKSRLFYLSYFTEILVDFWLIIVLILNSVNFLSILLVFFFLFQNNFHSFLVKIISWLFFDFQTFSILFLFHGLFHGKLEKNLGKFVRNSRI